MSSIKYCIDIFKYQRYKTSEVRIGNLLLGNGNPIVVQSMTTTNTNDVDATVKQIESIAKAGGQMVRMTTQGQREAKNLELIKKGVVNIGCHVPLVADIHYNPNAANIAAKFVEKVRINPGNFVDGAKKFENIEYTNESYQEELFQVKKKLIPLLNICKDNNTAIRIGTNHGSLSDRIMSRYGDTPNGMVESCMEFLRICEEQDFRNIVLSIKASNARVMVHTVRLLVQKMSEEAMAYPLHLGVTEAGEGEDGRIRSAVGIGTLLADGIGDTIRVSLTEDPENEIPVANQIIDHIQKSKNHTEIRRISSELYSPFDYKKRITESTGVIGGNNQPVVIGKTNDLDGKPDLEFSDEKLISGNEIVNCKQFIQGDYNTSEYVFIKLVYSELNTELASLLQRTYNAVIILDSETENTVAEQRAAFLWLMNQNVKTPVVIYRSYNEVSEEKLQIIASCEIGPLLIDGYGDGVWIDNLNEVCLNVNSIALSILQAARVRFSKPDYISCPGCGRTLFGLQETTSKVKNRTAHLKGLKIAVMGCIVNGPGEMADADYGYVGSGPGKITLYHQKEVVKKNIDEEDAVEELISLIKKNGDWKEPN